MYKQFIDTILICRLRIPPFLFHSLYRQGKTPHLKMFQQFFLFSFAFLEFFCFLPG